MSLNLTLIFHTYSKFLPRGSIRIGLNVSQNTDLETVAFLTEKGATVLIVSNRYESFYLILFFRNSSFDLSKILLIQVDVFICLQLNIRVALKQKAKAWGFSAYHEPSPFPKTVHC